MIRKSGYDKVLNNIIPAETDTLLANILFRLFNRREPISFAYAWYRGSYANILYPDAAFDFPGVANFLSRLGQNAVLDNFFRRHLDYFANTDAPELKSSGYVLVGRADAKNIIKTPRAARENYNISEKNSQKLVCAIDVFSSIPLMFNLFDENVADASALGNAIASLKSYGFNFKRAIVDAGYFSRNNISELYARDIPFIVKLDSSSALYAKIWKNLSQNIRVSKNSLFYGKRSPYGKKDRINLFGRAAYAYAITDFHRKSDPLYNLKLSEHRGKINADRENDLRNYSSFVMLSSANIQLLEALALYRARLKIERAFDIPKNRISSRIPRDHSLERRKGRATINFIAATLRLTLSRLLGESEYDASRALFEMRRLRVNMENGKPHSIEEINKDASAIIQALSLKLPVA
ncbi:MAG: transposase [Deltaproteobacteria bacterium]|nr:transposase [Deltaproteobacteria bacterium]